MFMFDIPLFQNWINFTAPENRICWNVFIQLGVEPVANEQIKNSHWTPQQRQKKYSTLFATSGPPKEPLEICLMQYLLTKFARSSLKTCCSIPGTSDKPF
ncbi:hypothetical protein BGX24_005251 [Mortierella sp. AD032]|nr:hypothetical protein BGX24_005251 [Mortierella sp. AD032]